MLAAALCGLLGCGDCGGCGSKSQATNPSDPAAAALSQASGQQPEAKAAANARSASSNEDAGTSKSAPYLEPGWSKIDIKDRVPICVFSTYADYEKSHFIKDVPPKQELKAGESILVGAYAAWCVNEACDAVPSLQCSVERKGHTLTVHTRYWGGRKDGASCPGTECRPINASCRSPRLEAGEYTVTHGELSFELHIPSVLDAPCFGTDERNGPEDL